MPGSPLLPLALTAGVAIAVAGLLWFEAREARRAALVWKTAASLGFVALGVALRPEPATSYATLVLVGLGLAAGGDVALAVPGERAFLVGLGLFLLGHLAYVAAFATRVPMASWVAPVALVPVAAALGAYAWLSPHLGSLRGPVVAYVTAITLMVVGALAAFHAGVPRRAALLGGASAFFLSDLSVARDRFVARGFLNRAWGLPAYYAGQVLLAWSTA